MVQFKSWEDFKLFMETFATCSCFNCTGYHDDKDFNGMFICWKTLSPVRMDMIQVCAEWESSDGKTLSDYDDLNKYNLSDEIIEKLDSITELMSYEDILEVVNE